MKLKTILGLLILLITVVGCSTDYVTDQPSDEAVQTFKLSDNIINTVSEEEKQIILNFAKDWVNDDHKKSCNDPNIVFACDGPSGGVFSVAGGGTYLIDFETSEIYEIAYGAGLIWCQNNATNTCYKSIEKPLQKPKDGVAGKDPFWKDYPCSGHNIVVSTVVWPPIFRIWNTTTNVWDEISHLNVLNLCENQ